MGYAADALTEPLPWGVDVRRSCGGTHADQRQVLDLARMGAITVDTTTYPQAFVDLEVGRVRGRAVLVP